MPAHRLPVSGPFFPSRDPDDWRRFLPSLSLHRCGAAREAGLWTVSLPWPKQEPLPLSLGGRPTHVAPLGRWPGTDFPRRLLLTAQGDGPAPEEVPLSGRGGGSSGSLPKVSMELLEKSPHRFDYWERHYLQVTTPRASLGIALGLRTEGEVHWWEACRLVVLDQSPECLTVEMGGAIPHRITSRLPGGSPERASSAFLHRHNWLNGRLYLRLHANGVCEVFAHTINSRFFDDGLALDDVVPVVGFRSGPGAPAMWRPGERWCGTPSLLKLGGVSFDFGDAARLATPQQPGRWDEEGSFLVWQPYAGVELFGGAAAEQKTGDPFLFRPEAKHFPRGMARTLRFSFSLSGQSPTVARYLPPAWWYGLCEEFTPAALLPVTCEWETAMDEAREWVRTSSVACGFEEGAVPRYLETAWETPGGVRHEAGWDGEMPYAQFLDAWRTGCGEDYERALRSAWHFTDVAVDHAAKLVRMHGFGPHSFSLPMNRMQGTLAAYLETGVPYLLETARAVVSNAHWQHLNSWPRHAVGRDVCYVRGAVLLYRYFGDAFYKEIAREGALTLACSQEACGSFGDQGGGTGLHQRAGYLAKPWMGLLGLNGVLDYLEIDPDEPQLQNCVRRFADWLLAERWERDGRTTWSYEHAYLGEREFPLGPGHSRALPTQERWHQETLARLLGYCALRYDQPVYLQAWRESYLNTLHAPATHTVSSNTVAPLLEFLPWLAARLLHATATGDGVAVEARLLNAEMPLRWEIATPYGRVPLTRQPDEAAFRRFLPVAERNAPPAAVNGVMRVT